MTRQTFGKEMQETLMALNSFNALDKYTHRKNSNINMKKMPSVKQIRIIELFQKLKDNQII